MIPRYIHGEKNVKGETVESVRNGMVPVFSYKLTIRLYIAGAVSGLKLLCDAHLGSLVGLICFKLCPFLAGFRE